MVDSVGQTGKLTAAESKKGEKDKIKKINSENNGSEIPQHSTAKDGTDSKKKRKHRKYKTTINLSALKEMEGTTAGSFLDLSKAVILIDGKPYDEDYLALSKERKNDFRRLIEHYAVMDVIGKRKYHIKMVYSKEQREELNKLEIASNQNR